MKGIITRRGKTSSRVKFDVGFAIFTLITSSSEM